MIVVVVEDAPKVESVDGGCDRFGVGARIRAARQDRKLTQLQLADRLGLSSERTIHKWENGSTLPTLITFRQLCLALDVRPADLLGFK